MGRRGASADLQDVRMNWARRLKRVFGIEIEPCSRCGGRLRVIASIDEPELIERILSYRRERGEDAPAPLGGADAPQVRYEEHREADSALRQTEALTESAFRVIASRAEGRFKTPIRSIALPSIRDLQCKALHRSSTMGGS